MTLDDLGGPSAVTRVLGEGGRITERRCDVCGGEWRGGLCRWGKGHEPRMSVASRSWVGQGNGFYPGASRRTPRLEVGPVRLISDV